MSGNNIGATTGDHNTIQLWVNTHVNSTTLSGVVTGTIVDDAVYDEHVTFTAVVSDASNYAVITVADAVRAKGITGGGARVFPTDDGHAINSANCDFLVVEHLEIHPGTAKSDECFRAGDDNQTIQNCLCVGRGQATTPYQQDAVHHTNISGGVVNVYNCMMQNFSRTGVYLVVSTGSYTMTMNVKNCTVLNCGLNTGPAEDKSGSGGISASANTGETALANIDNVIAMNCHSPIGSSPGQFMEQTNSGTITWTGQGNIASDTSATGKLGATNNLNSATATTATDQGSGNVVFTNITVGTEDLHLKTATGNEAENAESSISFVDTVSDTSPDMDGDARTAALMDSGADQISFAAADTTHHIHLPLLGVG